MTKLPAWIEAIAKETGTSSAAFNPRLIEALGIAWEALEANNSKACDKAMRQIEELGK